MSPNTVATNEYIAPDSTLAFMLNYWHGWWRFMYHWHPENQGIVLPDLKCVWGHRKYCDGSWDKIGICLTVWRLTLCFSCLPIERSHIDYRKLYADDIWPTLIFEDGVLESEFID